MYQGGLLLSILVTHVENFVMIIMESRIRAMVFVPSCPFHVSHGRLVALAAVAAFIHITAL